MKNIIFATLLFGLGYPMSLRAQETQIGGLFGKVRKALSKSDAASWKPGNAITTSIDDSLHVIRWLNESDFIAADADSISSFNLKPGYYRATIRSYCLHAGAYAPTKGSGYQIAQLKGSRATLINSILQKSANHPEIAQYDIQTLIWGIEAGAKFSGYPLDYQARMKPLLTATDIAGMEVNVNDYADKLIPSQFKSLSGTYASLRDKMNSSQMKYDDIEKIAVKSGIPPTGLGSKEIKAGLWSYIGNGFYLRAYPQSYPTTNIELYRPAVLAVTRDDKNRISTFSKDGNKVSIEYDDSEGADVFKSNGHPDIPVWRFKKITFQGKDSSQIHPIACKGWILRGSKSDLDRAFAATKPEEADVAGSGLTEERPLTGQHGPLMNVTKYNDNQSDNGNEPTYDDARSKYSGYKELYEELKTAYEWLERAGEADDIKNPDEYLNQAAANKQVADGLKAAVKPTDFNDKSMWISDLMKMDRDLAYYITCQLQGSCDNSNDPKKPDLPSHPAQPGNSSMQRLGLSPYKTSN
jgi:hypothetical protein